MLFASLSPALSRDTFSCFNESEKTNAEACMIVSSLATCLEDEVLEGNTLMAYFNITHPEFLEFANTNDVRLIELLEYTYGENFTPENITE